MEQIIELIRQPWPWYVAGPIIGLTVPLLLVLGNKTFGISSSLRHVCAMCIPASIPFFQYNWRKEIWNLVFAAGIIIGAFIAVTMLSSGDPVAMNERLKEDLGQSGITDFSTLLPGDLFNFHNLLTLKGFVFIVAGGFLVGFGTRYAGGCTSGHSISGISMLQMPSVIATICFMAGGIIVANFVVPYILQW